MGAPASLSDEKNFLKDLKKYTPQRPLTTAPDQTPAEGLSQLHDPGLTPGLKNKAE